jgi:hypothetical protein
MNTNMMHCVMIVKRFIYFYGKIDSRSGIACKGQRLVWHAGRVAGVSGRPFPDVFQDKIEQTVRSFLSLLLFFRVLFSVRPADARRGSKGETSKPLKVRKAYSET